MYNLVRTSPNIPFLNTENLEYGKLGKPSLYNNILETIGNTPLVKLNKIPKDHGLQCDIYVKCEYMNPGGSIKDRIAFSMIEDAVKHHVVRKDSVFVEPTSGNTGIGVAFVAAVKGHNSIIVTSEKNSDEKSSAMRVLGAEVIQIKDTDPESEIARRIKNSDPEKMVMPDQFDNDVNPRTHYLTTAEEILSALEGKVDLVAMGAGSGGTLSGVSHKFKERNSKCIVVGADPKGSRMLNKIGKFHPFLVEGIGGSVTPIVLDSSLVDDIEVITDEESFLTARELSRKEGILCGGSSGTALAAGIKAAKKYNLGPGKTVVVVLPDGIRNYMSKFVSDQWMEAHLFMDPPQHTMKWWREPVTKLIVEHKYPIIDKGYNCDQAFKAMDKESLAVVVDDKGYFIGAVSKDELRHFCTNPTKLPNTHSEDFKWKDPVTDHLVKHCYTLARNGKKGMPYVGLVSRVLDITPFVVIGTEKKDEDTVHFIPDGVVTTDEVLPFIKTFAPNPVPGSDRHC